MNQDQQTVIVYRSQLEAQQDAYWAAHPEYVVYGFYAVGAIILLVVLIMLWQQSFMGRRRNSRGGMHFKW